ncbi:MAG TPA: heme ABC exporter ATP-binding protein CcmA [Longimicrobiales bacterium]|nr:heme ABC exporter ATP-binding protein CcmA [Longimicrobiales bacterium]
MTDGAATGPALELAQVARRFGRRWALRGVSLRVESGQVLALAGHNGSGKTTLLRVIGTALRPSKGGGRVFGKDLVRDADEVRARVGSLSHAAGTYGDLTAHENLAFALRMAGLRPDHDAVRATLETVGLGRFAEERARTFSSGMTRRLALARLLLNPPKLLLLDEPYASFDVAGVALVNEFILKTARDGGTVIVATHDLDRASAVMERVVELRNGQVVGDEPYQAGPRLAATLPDTALLGGGD